MSIVYYKNEIYSTKILKVVIKFAVEVHIPTILGVFLVNLFDKYGFKSSVIVLQKK